jgi:hypothetical protein
MACDCLLLKNSDEFYSLLKKRDPDLVVKMVKCVLKAIKNNKKQIDIFDITFKNMDSLMFGIEKEHYVELLTNCLKDLEKLEEFELCASITKVINKKPRKRRKPQEQQSQ